VSHENHRALVQHQRLNHSSLEKAFIQRLMDDHTITCKPADKNLGLVLVDTSWYDAELKRMLSDTTTYAKFKDSVVVKGKLIKQTVEQLKDRLFDELHALTKLHTMTIWMWYPALADQILKFLDRKITKKAAAIPCIYLILKVHKAKLSGRPIVPCTKWITTSASVAVDHLLQDILCKAAVPWIVKDTKSLVNELEATVLPSQDGIFVTADIASLYTNIDTTMGLACVQQFLTEQQVAPDLARLIMDLLRFVMHNAYLSFKDQVYHQIDGTAMGTACAPTYANIFVFILERVVIAELKDAIRIYRRFLDDVFVFIKADRAAEFQRRMNELHPKIKFEFVTHPSEAVFLDLLIHKGPRFAADSIFDLRVHQKAMNLYLYIPWLSFHTEAAKKSFIQTELMRYVRNSSSRDDYLRLKRIFYQRLRDRGYPHAFLRPLFQGVLYADRHYFLYPSRELQEHPTIHSHPPVSECLRRRLARQANVVSSDQQPPVFVVPYTPLSRVVPTRSILSHHWWIMSTGASLPRPIIAYQSYPSLMAQLVFQKAKRAEEARVARLGAPARTTQITLAMFGRRAPRAADSSS
jgi:hypothetical protein